MSVMAKHSGPTISKYGESYWNDQIAIKRSNSSQRAVVLLRTEKQLCSHHGSKDIRQEGIGP
jgi:hypothetical protein